MHASLAVALTYDRHLNAPPGCRRTLEEVYHWSQSTVLFNARLREPISARDKDAIWGTAAALAVLTFAIPDARTPDQAWPLKSSSAAADLDWLRMSNGKMALWHLANPLRPDSLFRVLAPTYAQMHAPLPEGGIDGIPRALAGLCGLDDASTAGGNPYLRAAHAVAWILELADGEVTLGMTQPFTGSIRGEFEGLLRERDAVALVLLYLWYCKAGRGVWWIGLRARVEGPAICAYLRRYHGGDGAVMAFLPGGAMAGRWG